MLTGWFDRDGQPINDPHEAERLLSDLSYKRIARTKIMNAADPAQVFDVSTVWLGLDHAFGGGPPLLFETMVFATNSSLDMDTRRYGTEQEARGGHDEFVTVIAATLDDPVVMDATDDTSPLGGTT